MPIAVTVLQALWFIWPAYTANAFPAVLGGKKPLDCGRRFGKNRILGDSKTIEGTIGGVLFGIFIGIIQMQVYDYLPQDLGLARLDIPLVVALSAGALAGDITGSFIKRRMDVAPGKPVLLLDQIGFLIAALALASLIRSIAFELVILLIVLTPAIHFLTNMVGYAAKLKKEPW